MLILLNLLISKSQGPVFGFFKINLLAVIILSAKLMSCACVSQPRHLPGLPAIYKKSLLHTEWQSQTKHNYNWTSGATFKSGLS